jgi:hypothetical protein
MTIYVLCNNMTLYLYNDSSSYHHGWSFEELGNFIEQSGPIMCNSTMPHHNDQHRYYTRLGEFTSNVFVK